jgi:type III secretion protein W
MPNEINIDRMKTNFGTLSIETRIKVMPQRIESSQPSQEQIAKTHPHDQVVEGSFKGERVSVQRDATSLVSDAAEELTFSASEKVEKDIKKRKIGKKKEIKQAFQAELYVKKVPDLKQEDLLSFLKHIRKNRPNTMHDLLQEAKSSFKDVTHQYLALSFVKEMLDKEEGDSELGKTLEASIEYLMETEGTRIRAGLNVTEVAQEFSNEGFASTQNLRDFYRDTVLKYEGLKETYDSIVRNFDPEGFIQATQYLIKAVGNDLHSKGPSVSSLELKMILDDLYHLESLGNLYRNCSELIAKTNHEFDEKIKLTPHNAIQMILSFKDEKWITENQILNFSQSAGIKDLEGQIYFLRGLKELVRLMPLKLFSDDENRHNLISKMQQVLDTLIGQEE